MSPPAYRVSDFAQEVQGRYTTDDPDSFWQCEAAVRRLIADGAAQHWLGEQLGALLKEPQYIGDWGPKEVVLHRSAHWTLSIALLDTQQRYVHALPFLAFYAPLESELIGDRYRLPDNFRNDVFDPALRIEPAGNVRVAAKEVLCLEADRYAYSFHISKSMPVLRFTTASLRPLEWLFSKSTLQAWQANDADLSSTQLRVAAFVLGKIAHNSSIKPLLQLASHPHHAVRWAAIQNLGRLSRSEALVKIREAVNDPHPHVRRAAQKTLEQLDRRTQR